MDRWKFRNEPKDEQLHFDQDQWLVAAMATLIFWRAFRRSKLRFKDVICSKEKSKSQGRRSRVNEEAVAAYRTTKYTGQGG